MGSERDGFRGVVCVLGKENCEVPEHVLRSVSIPWIAWLEGLMYGKTKKESERAEKGKER